MFEGAKATFSLRRLPALWDQTSVCSGHAEQPTYSSSGGCGRSAFPGSSVLSSPAWHCVSSALSLTIRLISIKFWWQSVSFLSLNKCFEDRCREPAHWVQNSVCWMLHFGKGKCLDEDKSELFLSLLSTGFCYFLMHIADNILTGVSTSIWLDLKSAHWHCR